LPGQRDDHAPLAEVHVQHGPTGIVAALVGELDMSNADDIHQQLSGAAAHGGVLVVDLSGLGFIDSAGIAVLDRLHRDLASGPTELRVAATADSVAARTLSLAGMDRVLPMTPAVANPDPAG
jgi:anti-sigma B factor antagonist